MNIRESHVAASVEIRQQGMVQAHEVQDRGVQVVDVDSVLNGSVTEIIRGPDSLTAFYTAPGHPS